MSTRKNLLQRIEKLPETTIVEYLQKHPDFFTRHQNLLASLEIPQESGTVVSLPERKLAALREENQKLQRQLDELITVAQENEQLNQRIRRLIVALISAPGIDEFFQTLYTTLSSEFNTDVVVVRCFEVSHVTSERPEFVEFDAQVFTLFEEVLDKNKPLCGQLSEEQNQYLFPNHQIASAVLTPLGTPQLQGLLAMGSEDASRFHADMSTDFLTYLGELLGHLLIIRFQPL